MDSDSRLVASPFVYFVLLFSNLPAVCLLGRFVRFVCFCLRVLAFAIFACCLGACDKIVGLF